ncbi:MAG TPA: Fe-only nitrogenase accessory AnfO family protein [Methanocellaceae archaeon]|jgi:Fe-only nitrogenase accessory protein AnfO
MAKEIAVFIGADDASTSLDEPGKVKVFRRALGSWELNREKEFSMGDAKSMRELRLRMSEIIRFMDGCRVFVARSASGVPYFELEKAGCTVWECEGKPSAFLERVWDQEEKDAMAKAPEPQAMPAPEERTPGDFFISIKEIQRNTPEVTSKQVLRQFIRSGAFRTLEVVCGHVPPWLEIEAVDGGLTYEAEQLDKNEFKVKIAKKTPV